MNIAFPHQAARPMRRLSVATWIRNAAAVLTGHWGEVPRQAKASGCSRQTAYQHAQHVQEAVAAQDSARPTRQELLAENQALRRENRQLWNWLEHTIEFPKSHQRHVAVVAAAMGLSARPIAALLALILSGGQGPSHATVRRWVHHEALKAGPLLRRLDRACKALVTLAGLDEIFLRRQPVLVAVEPQSMAWVLGQRTRDRSGPTWAAALPEWSALQAVFADGGTGRHAGLEWVPQPRRACHRDPLDVGRDGFHTQRDAQRLLRSIGSRAEGLWTKAEDADRHVAQDQHQGRDARKAAARARRAWERTRRAFHHAEAVQAAGQEIEAALQVFSPEGQWNERAAAERPIAQAIPRLTGADWSKVIRLLRDPRSVMFLERLHRQLRVAELDPTRRAELVRLWWLRRHRPRDRSASTGGAAAQIAHLVPMQVCAGLGADWVVASRRISRVLWSTVRARSAVECMNRVIRMHQARHRSLTQPLLDLKRLYWNGRVFEAGKRRGRCPYQHLGLTCLSDLYATAESVWSSISTHSGEGTSVPDGP